MKLFNGGSGINKAHPYLGHIIHIRADSLVFRTNIIVFREKSIYIYIYFFFFYLVILQTNLVTLRTYPFIFRTNAPLMY